jgi:PAS domain S-box-containing protein
MEPILLRRDQGYGFHVSEAGRRLLGPRRIDPSVRRWVERSSFTLGDVTWDFRVWPVAAQLQQARTRLPDLLLLLGLLVTALLPVTVRLGQINWMRARLAERVRLKLALETATDSLWEWNVQTGEAIRGEALWRHLGYPANEAVGTMAGWMELMHPDDRRRVTAALTKHLSGESPTIEHHYRIRDRAGDWHWLIDRGRVVERASNGAAIRVLGISADITERKRADEAREASERRFRACFDSAYQGQILLDLSGRILEANRTACKLLGVEPEILAGARLWDSPWWRAPAGHRAGLREAFAAALAGDPVRFETDLHGADGRPFVIDLSFSPIQDGAGRISQLLLEWRDITERKRAEDVLREVESLSTMGRLAARIAHEINNPLAGIQNAFRLIKDAVPSNHPHRRYVGAIEGEISRIAGVTRQLYETYRPEHLASRETAVGSLIGDAVAMLEQVNRDSGVRIVTDFSSAPPLVPLPDAVLRQAVYNLVQNAIEASPPGGTVTVSALVEDEAFVLRVRDEGPGVPREIRDRIFDPFFTTKSASLRTGGMGLGLSLVHRSVHAFGGRVDFVDLPGGGTEFEVRLPLTPIVSGVHA